MTTTSYLIERWADEPDDGQTADDWPYPAQHARFRVLGDLANRTRERSHLEGDVSIVESVISGGWSEWTQEDDYEFDVYVGDQKVWSAGTNYRAYDEKDDDIGRTTFATFQHWLNNGA